MSEKLDDEVPRGWNEYFTIALRRRWWILTPLFLSWLTVWGVSWLLPPTYESEAMILVDQQKVPDQYVVPNVSVGLQDRLQSISQQVLSRTRLQAMIDRLHLYQRPRGLRDLLKSGDAVEQMRNDITIELVRAPGHPEEFTAFKMRYSAGSPELAQFVNTDLTSLFVNENMQAQQQLSEDTTSFLESQLADAQLKMEAQEAKVAAFKGRHLGELPGQLESNVQILAGIQAQLQSAQQALDSARQQKLYMESLLEQHYSVRPRSVSIRGGTGVYDSTISPREALDKQLLDLRLRLQDLQSRYTDNHPDVVTVKDDISKAEKLQKALVQETGNAAPSDETQSDPSIIQLQSQLRANQLEIQNYQRRESDLESQASSYRVRLNMTSETEQQLTDISRGYEESKANYNSLLQKQMQSQLATSLEQRQKGEQFRIVDPASLPTKPSAPNHLKFSIAGLALGIALGLGFAALLEITDDRVHTEIDLRKLVPVRVLVGIPHLSTPNEKRIRTITMWLELGSVTVIGILIAVGNLYAFYKR